MAIDIALSTEQRSWLDRDNVAIPTDDAVIRVSGPAALQCVQGLFTNQLEGTGGRLLRFGAVLTPKGMIITPLWVCRDPDGLWLVVPSGGKAALMQLLVKSFPPRLAKVEDRSAEVTAWWLTGTGLAEADGVELIAPTGPAPFEMMALGPSVGIERMATEAGWTIGDSSLVEFAHLIGGWPRLGREIDERTLVQEVRFDELEAVAYDKGCYVGQETVARLHFRGRANRTLRSLSGEGDPPSDRSVVSGDKEVARIATLATVGESWIASAKIRREVETGDLVTVDGREIAVGGFPLEL